MIPASDLHYTKQAWRPQTIRTTRQENVGSLSAPKHGEPPATQESYQVGHNSNSYRRFEPILFVFIISYRELGQASSTTEPKINP